MSFGEGTTTQGQLPTTPSAPPPPPMFGQDNIARKKPGSNTNPQQRQMAGTLLGAQQGGNPTNLGTKTLLGQ